MYRSRPVSDSLDPTWDSGEIDLASICNGDLVRAPLVFYTLIPISETLQLTCNSLLDYQEPTYSCECISLSKKSSGSPNRFLRNNFAPHFEHSARLQLGRSRGGPNQAWIFIAAKYVQSERSGATLRPARASDQCR